MFQNCQVSSVDRAYQWSVLKGTRTTFGIETGQKFGIAQAGSTSYYYTSPLLSGIVGSIRF